MLNIRLLSRIRRCRCFNRSFLNAYSSQPERNVAISVRGTSLTNYIKQLEEEYSALSLSSNYNSNSRWLELGPIMQILKERNEIIKNISDLKDLVSGADQELSKLAELENLQHEQAIKEVDERLVDALLPREVDDLHDSLVLEVQAGVGGQEAMLFAKELFEMYCNFAEYKGWEINVAEYATSDIAGVRNAVALINGRSAFQYFKHEAGVHRVQRIPSTEKSGRIHTSTASVLALPQPTDIEVNIQQKDLKIETKRSSGAGGQHVNKTESAVRIVHLPTGIAVECQVDRSQIKNRKLAMARLTALLYQKEQNTRNKEIRDARKSQVQTSNRNEKIRTYNFLQDRIKDHRLSDNIHNLKGFMEGREALEYLIKQLDQQYRVDSLLSIVNSNRK